MNTCLIIVSCADKNQIDQAVFAVARACRKCNAVSRGLVLTTSDGYNRELAHRASKHAIDVRVTNQPRLPKRIRSTLNNHITDAMVLKLQIDNYLPHENRYYVYLDTDILINSDLSESLGYFDGFSLLAAKDVYVSGAHLGLETYFNAGVLFFDRFDSNYKEAIALAAELAATMPYEFPEQDALNVAFVDLWKPFPDGWLTFVGEDMKDSLTYRHATVSDWESMSALHFVGPRKPWMENAPSALKYLYQRR